MGRILACCLERFQTLPAVADRPSKGNAVDGRDAGEPMRLWAGMGRVLATSSTVALLALCGLLFASRIMVTKAALGAGAQPFQLGLIGNAGAGLCLLPWLLASGQGLPRGWRAGALFVVLGVVSVAVPTVLSNLVVQRVGPAYAATVYALSPLLTMSFAAGFGVERMFPRRALGIGLGFVGMLTLVWQQVAAIDLGQPAWVVIGLAIPACAALGNIIRSAFWPAGASALAFSCGTLFTASLTLGLLAPLFEDPRGWRWADPPMLGWTLLLVAASAVSYLMNFRLQRIGGPVVFSQLGYWGTGFGVLLSALLFGDVLTALSVLGLGLIVWGGLLARRPPG